MQRVQLFLLIRLIDLPQTPTKCGLGSQRRDTNIFGSKRVIQIFEEPEHISVGARRTIARFSENQSTVLREPEHGSPRTRARFSENQSTVSENQITVLREPEHGSLRTRARFSENQSTVLQEPEHGSLRIRAHLSWRTGKHLHVLHVLRTYPTCSYPGYQDTTTYAALLTGRLPLWLLQHHQGDDSILNQAHTTLSVTRSFRIWKDLRVLHFVLLSHCHSIFAFCLQPAFS